MKLQSVLKTICYKAGFTIKAIRKPPRSAAHGGQAAGLDFDVRGTLHRTDPYEGFDSSAYPRDLHGWGGQSAVFRKLIFELRPRLIIEVGTWKGASAVEMA